MKKILLLFIGLFAFQINTEELKQCIPVTGKQDTEYFSKENLENIYKRVFDIPSQYSKLQENIALVTRGVSYSHAACNYEYLVKFLILNLKYVKVLLDELLTRSKSKSNQLKIQNLIAKVKADIKNIEELVGEYEPEYEHLQQNYAQQLLTSLSNFKSDLSKVYSVTKKPEQGSAKEVANYIFTVLNAIIGDLSVDEKENISPDKKSK